MWHGMCMDIGMPGDQLNDHSLSLSAPFLPSLLFLSFLYFFRVNICMLKRTGIPNAWVKLSPIGNARSTPIEGRVSLGQPGTHCLLPYSLRH